MTGKTEDMNLIILCLVGSNVERSEILGAASSNMVGMICRPVEIGLTDIHTKVFLHTRLVFLPFEFRRLFLWFCWKVCHGWGQGGTVVRNWVLREHFKQYVNQSSHFSLFEMGLQRLRVGECQVALRDYSYCVSILRHWQVTKSQ